MTWQKAAQTDHLCHGMAVPASEHDCLAAEEFFHARPVGDPVSLYGSPVLEQMLKGHRI